MNGRLLGGCGCAGGLVLLLVLSVPLLFLGGNGSTGEVSAAASTSYGGQQQVMPAGGPSCNAAVDCQPIPVELGYVPPGFFPDTFTNPPGECTSWAAALWPGHRGRGVSWGGDAWEWFANAATQGYSVTTTPSVGAIAVFRRSSGDAGEWGHVGVVVDLTTAGFRVTEMNVVGRFVVDERDVSDSDSGLAGFIPVPTDALS